MTPSEFLEAVRTDNETALSRLGSSKALYADTGGELDAEHVLRAAADAELVAMETFEAWAQEEPNEDARETFDTTADEERAHTQAITAELDDYDPDETPSAMHAHLRELETTVERAGGLLGRTLAAEQSKQQLVGFFVGQADPQTADVFRDLKADVDDQRDRTLDLLDALCDTDDAWNRAKTAADDTIQAAYDDYVEQLQAQGVDPKPVC
ncbi:rubrerythrin family protein [Halobacterium zhouii]|uniref:rubrerythrin family protein n=1 Tax=Halobacterium zhouii TaxID=2902624 RepID=UPI001E5E901C|nr:rubrerythrin family protein [Halobacterium zhouii]